jgi:hypothetical protein
MGSPAGDALSKTPPNISATTEAFRNLAVSNGLIVAPPERLKTAGYKSLQQEILFEEPASHGYSTRFSDDPHDDGIDFEALLLDIGDRVGRIHGESDRLTLSMAQSDFDPLDRTGQHYWEKVSQAIPRFAARLEQFSEEAAQIEATLLYGNLSLQSFWFNRNGQAAILDAERAHFGDPAFEVAHMMAHLFLASVHRRSTILLTATGSFHAGYVRATTSFDKVSMMYRAGPMNVALLLAFVLTDDLSSCLSTSSRDDVAAFASWWLDRRDYTLGQVRDALWTAIDMGFNNTSIDWRQKFSQIPRANC